MQYRVPVPVEETLIKSRILAPQENPQQMFVRVIQTLFSVEHKWNVKKSETEKNRDLFASLMVEKAILPGTPTLTNAGRPEYSKSALSSCVVIPVDLRDKEKASTTIKSYYRQNMGSGFDFTPYDDPVGLLLWLNELSVNETKTGLYDRYIGNMGSLNVSHPKIHEFIRAKRENKIKHFNISVDVSEEFMEAALNGQKFTLANGKTIDAKALLTEMAENAHFNGDPGLIYLDRMNRDNPVEAISSYTSTPPCSEMGLAPGETCQFGYINLSKFVSGKDINWEKLEKATEVMTRALDNAIEVSLSGYPSPESLKIANLKRKIGIGVCGLADVFIKLDIAYESDEAIELARNILSFINFKSKLASIKLAESRGACDAMTNRTENKYYSRFIEDRYMQQPTDTVSRKDWNKIAGHIKKTGMLRNILTTALPPTGRASILLGVISSIEPLFSTSGWHEGTREAVHDFIKKHTEMPLSDVLKAAEKDDSFQSLPITNKEVLKTAKEIDLLSQIRMISAIAGSNGIYDEAASKTINLAKSSSVDDVLNIFLSAHKFKLKNISVYRDGSYINQPEKL